MTISEMERYIVPEPNSGCWLWMGGLIKGYGQVMFNGKNFLTHRLVYERYRGPIPTGLHIDHQNVRNSNRDRRRKV